MLLQHKSIERSQAATDAVHRLLLHGLVLTLIFVTAGAAL